MTKRKNREQEDRKSVAWIGVPLVMLVLLVSGLWALEEAEKLPESSIESGYEELYTRLEQDPTNRWLNDLTCEELDRVVVVMEYAIQNRPSDELYFWKRTLRDAEIKQEERLC